MVGGEAIKDGELGQLSDAGDDVAVKAGPDGVDFLLVSGIPLKEPVFQYGPFVMTTREEIIQAVEDFQAGRFGTIPATTS
jgi:redox-sensitive bicupin YhaK (pirin superfamily)